jgi:hypothetical protein
MAAFTGLWRYFKALRDVIQLWNSARKQIESISFYSLGILITRIKSDKLESLYKIVTFDIGLYDEEQGRVFEHNRLMSNENEINVNPVSILKRKV